MFDLNKVLIKNRINKGSEKYPFYMVKRLECKDGFSVSVQASEHTYCSPRINSDSYEIYYEFELGFPSKEDELINEFAEDQSDYTGTVYPYVPRHVVINLLIKHGGVINDFN